MKSNELRIGNWVSDSELGSVKVHEILFASTWVVFKHMGDDYEITESRKKIYNAELSPIQLTPEVLLGLGFKPHADRNNKAQLFFLNEFRYSVKWKQITLLRSCNAAGESQREACGHPFLTDRIQIEFLHQLQNLYFALTGNEIEYSPQLQKQNQP